MASSATDSAHDERRQMMQKRMMGWTGLIVLVAATVLVAAEPKEAKQAAALRLRITTPQPELTWRAAGMTHSMPGRVFHGVQPTVLKVTFENGTDKVITLQLEDGLWNLIEFDVEAPEDALRKTDVGKILTRRPAPKTFTVELAPGQTYDYTGRKPSEPKADGGKPRGPRGMRFPGRCGRWEYAFTKPGTYKVRARYSLKTADADNVWTGTVVSNELKLTVPERKENQFKIKPLVPRGQHAPALPK